MALVQYDSSDDDGEAGSVAAPSPAHDHAGDADGTQAPPAVEELDEKKGLPKEAAMTKAKISDTPWGGGLSKTAPFAPGDLPTVAQAEERGLLKPEPVTRVDPGLQSRVALFVSKVRAGLSLNEDLKRRREFHNPYINDQIRTRFGVERYGSNLDAHLDPSSGLDEHDNYKAIEREIVQNAERDVLERQQRQNLEFQAGGNLVQSMQLQAETQAAKNPSKWDSKPAASSRPISAYAARMMARQNQ